jgi:hypothetical protein
MISYRRKDSEGWVGRIYDKLIPYFGESQVFRDVDTLKPGARYEVDIEKAIGSADVVLVVIGPNWLNIQDEDGVRRLDHDNDLHRREVGIALQLEHICVIPVLVQGASMPRERDLPPDLKELAQRNQYELSDQRFPSDIAALIEFLATLVPMGDDPDGPPATRSAGDTDDAFIHKSFMAPGINVKSLGEHMAAWIEAQDFDVQLVSSQDRWIVQARRPGAIRNTLGMRPALTLALRRAEDVLQVDIRTGPWIDRVNGDRRHLRDKLDQLPLVGSSHTWATLQQENVPARILDEIRATISQARAHREVIPLRERMRREVRAIEEALGCTARLNEDPDGFIVAIGYTNSRGQLVEVFITCSPDYPDSPPSALLAINNHERSFVSPTLERWSADHSLVDVVEEVLGSS